MAGVLSIYVAAEANAEPTVVMHLHPEGLSLPDLAALGLRLGALAMAEAGKPPWFPAPDGDLPRRDGAHASGTPGVNTSNPVTAGSGGGGRGK